MININKVKQDIRDAVTKLAIERFGINEKEVKVVFKSNGELSITIIPQDFVNQLNINYNVTQEDN